MESDRSGPRLPVVVAGLALAYAALYELVTRITAFSDSAGTTFWPGAGLTVAVLLLRPRRDWPVLVVTIVIAEALMDLRAGLGAGLAVAWGVANAVEPLLAAALLTRGGRAAPNLARRHDLRRFEVIAVMVAPALGAFLGTLAGVVLTGDPWLPRLPRWYVGDAIGVLVIAPPILLRRRRAPHPAGRTMVWSAVALVAGTVVAVGPWHFGGDLGLPFLVLPLLSLVALTCGPRGAAFGTLFVAAVVEVVTAAGHGPFVGGGAFDGLVVAQMFVAMAGFTSMTTAALMSDLVSREELERRLRTMALHDSLTGLPNRRLLFDRLERAAAGLGRRDAAVAVLYIDIDDFKGINDRHGHAAGDAVLVRSAGRLAATVRDEDTVARLGGDEFVVVATVEDQRDAEALAQRIREALARPVLDDGTAIPVHASVGLATTTSRPEDLVALLAQADRAMYEAKAGRREPSAVAFRPA